MRNEEIETMINISIGDIEEEIEETLREELELYASRMKDAEDAYETLVKMIANGENVNVCSLCRYGNLLNCGNKEREQRCVTNAGASEFRRK